MVTIDPVSPGLPARPLGPESDRERRRQPPRERQPLPPSDDGRITDDNGDWREAPPLIDDFA
jgi:hypothetical protein